MDELGRKLERLEKIERLEAENKQLKAQLIELIEIVQYFYLGIELLYRKADKTLNEYDELYDQLTKEGING